MATRPTSKFSPNSPNRPDHANPLRELLVRLPLLKSTPVSGMNLAASPPELVHEIAAHAEQTIAVLNMGLAAIGNLWALASVDIEDGTVPMDCVESLGWLLSMLSECAASLLVLSAECRRAWPPPAAAGTPGQVNSA